MASLMSELRNPFLKDYSSSSILKRNYGVLQINSRIKQDKINPRQQYKTDTQKLTNSRITNPFTKNSLNALNMPQKSVSREFNNVQNRYLNQPRKGTFHSLDKNIIYKGLQQLGTKQLWKTQFQKQARYKLKNYGPQSLRYEYKKLQTFNPKNQQSSNVPIKSKNYFYDKQPISFNEKASHEYYGYDSYKNQKEDFPIKRGNQKKSSFKKTVAQETQKPKSNKRSQFQDIPQDKNQDFGTMHNLDKFAQISYYTDAIKQSADKLSEYKRSSIQSIQNTFQPQSSASSGFGNSSQMYESGANFRSKFSSNKQGPLNAHAFDDDKDEQLSGMQSSSGSKQKIFPETLQYNNKIYSRISF